MSLLLSNVLSGFLGECRKHNEDSGQISFDCPHCSMEKGMPEGDGKGNLEINYLKNVYKCWACYDINNMHGSVIKLIKKFGTPKNLRDYLLIKPDADEYSYGERKEIVVTLPSEYKKILENLNDPDAREALRYLRQRGITDDIINEYEIGYASTGKYYGRIIIPSFDIDGELNYFISRWYGSKYNKLKYLNPEAHKDSIIFNESRINWDSTIYLVEGVFDSIVTPNSIPLLGKFVSDKLLNALNEKAMGYVVIILDSDANDDADRLYDKLNRYNLENRVKISRCPENYDPSKIYEKFGAKGIIKLLKLANIRKDIF